MPDTTSGFRSIDVCRSTAITSAFATDLALHGGRIVGDGNIATPSGACDAKLLLILEAPARVTDAISVKEGVAQLGTTIKRGRLSNAMHVNGVRSPRHTNIMKACGNEAI